MDRNPSPPSSEAEEESDAVGSTVYSKHWLFSILTRLIELISPEKSEPSGNPEGIQTELDEEMENDICKVWDMSMDEDVALFLQEFNAPDIFMGVFAKSKCPRLTEICVGILGNMACFQDICLSISKDENLGQVLLQRLCDSDSPTLLETSRLLLTCLSQPEVANIWVERIRDSPSVYDCVCFIMSSSTNVELLVKVGEVVDKLFDLDEELMLNWIKSGTCQSVGPSTDDSPEELPDFKIVPCILEAAKQVRSDSPEGLDVYMHILQLLTTVDEGIQAIVQAPDGGKETWALLYDLICHELCQPDDPPIIVQEQKTVLASILSVLSAIFASQTEQEYIKMRKNMPLIGSLIRILQYMEGCGKRSVDNSKESEQEESGKAELKEEDFHLKILKDICCELLSNMFQELTKENTLEGLNQGHLNEQTCSCAFQNLLPLYFTSLSKSNYMMIEDNKENKDHAPERGRTAIIFSLKNEVGGLVKALKLFQEKHVNLVHIESRKSKRRNSEFEIFVDCDSNREQLNEIFQLLKSHVSIVSMNPTEHFNVQEDGDMENIPWYPKKISDLDKCANRVLMYGSDLDADHPGFKDNVYRKRRKYFADLAMNYKHGDPIPEIEFTEEEIKTWGTVYRELNKLYPTHACREYLKNLPLLTKYCGYREDNIPQLEDVSRFLKERTGFTIRPVAGYLSPRDFLAGLAFRVFHCTQYVRHSSDPLYTPEPDTCHELLGHVPLLAEPSFAQFSQEIGLASLGASDEAVQKLATCYFFTVEFGLCKQEGQLRVYGAGLLSSISELKHSLSGSAKVKPFDPKVTCKQECLITTFQEVYFVSESFEEAKEKMREFAKTIKRPFGVKYNPYTQSVQILKDTKSIASVVNELRHELDIVSDALSKMGKQLEV